MDRDQRGAEGHHATAETGGFLQNEELALFLFRNPWHGIWIEIMDFKSRPLFKDLFRVMYSGPCRVEWYVVISFYLMQLPDSKEFILPAIASTTTGGYSARNNRKRGAVA